jgi:hypothetical protein
MGLQILGVVNFSSKGMFRFCQVQFKRGFVALLSFLVHKANDDLNSFLLLYCTKVMKAWSFLLLN